MEKIIQVIYSSGTFGNCLRWMLDRFSKGSNFKDIDSPWDENNRVHGHEKNLYNKKFSAALQVDGKGNATIHPMADKVVISYKPKDLLFIERCFFYRGMLLDNEQHKNDQDHILKYVNIISVADQRFVNTSFGDVSSSKNVAKELYKIRFHNINEQPWWNAMNGFIADKRHYQFDINAFWNQDLLASELKNISEKHNLDLQISEKVLKNIVEKIKNSHVVMTKDRAHQVLDSIQSKNNMQCNALDILEQAYIEAELEKIHDSVLFPYGTNWFYDTHQINEFLETYPTYLKHMNPRLPWYNKIRNPFYLTGKIDKPK
jgi:hypothetical protein